MWVVAKTKGKQEKRAKINLENQGFTVFLPYFNSKIYRKDEWQEHIELLFPGYIFINLSSNLNFIHKIKNTLGVSKLLLDPCTCSPSILRDEIISEIQKKSKKFIKISDIKIGDKVVYTYGTLSGIHGTVTELSGRKRIKLLINLINSQREVLVNSQNIQRVYG